MIAIKGMEMPNSCADCQMSYLSGWEVVCCHCVLGVYGISDIDWAHERHENCPLVECIGIIRGYKEHKPKFDFDDEVDEIRKDCVIVKNKGGYFGTVQEEISEALPPIDLREMDRWIPVSEKLPKEKGYYLITRKNPNGHVTKVSYDPSRVERGVYNSPWGHGDADVLAWMELPKPYEEEK